MTTLTLQIIEKLIEIERQIRYDELPDADQQPFQLVVKNAPVLISAPHGAKTFRNSKKQIWHEEDEYTASMALILSEICDVSVIAMRAKCGEYDPNFTNQDTIPYKYEVGRLIKENGIRFVIDLHGAALYSPVLDTDQTIDLGLRQRSETDNSSFNLHHVEQFEHFLYDLKDENFLTDFIVHRNKFPAASSGTITSFASKQKIPNTDSNIQAIQIEMKPQVRVVRRFKNATLYKSCGPYEADPRSVLHMLQSLVNFIEYLKKQAP